jgi:tripartite-type tricarboxylate transporter receptor subunit TctC
MHLSRRLFLPLATTGLALPALSRTALAQAYPVRPVRIIVGYPAGGPIDIVARLVGEALSERLGKPFIIENRPGAGGNVGAETVVRAPADGYTLLLVGSNNYINATLYETLNFNFIRDIAPVGSIGRTPLVMEVNPSVPAMTVQEFIAYARANPGRLNMASGGVGTPVHMAGELFKMMAGVKMVHVPYRGSAPALADLVGGQVQVMFDTVSSSLQHVKAGKLRPLAVTTTTRLATLPDVPTVAETVPGYEVIAVQGLGAPRNTPSEVVERLHAALSDALGGASMRARFAELGIEGFDMRPAEFGELVAAETEKWAKVVRFAGVKAE